VKYLFFLLFSLPLFGVEWVTDFEKAKEMAKSQNRVIMMVITQEHCGACERLKDVTLEKEIVDRVLEKYYISTFFDINELPEKIRIKGTPTVKFYTPSGKRLRYTIVGDMSYKKLAHVLDVIRTKLLK
jgi:thioredoxin-related protein